MLHQEAHPHFVASRLDILCSFLTLGTGRVGKGSTEAYASRNSSAEAARFLANL